MRHLDNLSYDDVSQSSLCSGLIGRGNEDGQKIAFADDDREGATCHHANHADELEYDAAPCKSQHQHTQKER